LANVSAQWDNEEDKDTGEDLDEEKFGEFDYAVKDVTLDFSGDDKVAIVGAPGSGKTSLVLAMLNELRIVKGSVRINKSVISYVDQTCLIVTGTVRSNILFGLPYDEIWYSTIVDAVCLS
jgi:ABC-type multidrug transport system fused ATPase/permease subunit